MLEGFSLCADSAEVKAIDFLLMKRLTFADYQLVLSQHQVITDRQTQLVTRRQSHEHARTCASKHTLSQILREQSKGL